MIYTITIIFEDGFKTQHSTDQLTTAILVFRDEIKKHPDKMVQLKYCKNYKDY